MLQELRVENLLLIERAELRLAAGLNVLTGETGAGKTVLAHALDLLLGGRARPGIVRPGANEAYVEGVFELTPALRAQLGERLSADAEELVLARRVGADGRTRAYVGGRAATVGDLRDVGGLLLAFYGQHEHRKLTLSSAQLEILDGACGAAQVERLRACAAAFAEARELEGRLGALAELSAEREREFDLLEFELGEIEALAPSEEEHERLLATRERLRRTDALRSAAGGALSALAPEDDAPGATQLLASPLPALEALGGVDADLDELAARLRSLSIDAAELAAGLRAYGERLESGADGSLDAVEERLAAIERLVRKHGASVAAVLAFAEQARARRDELAGAEVATSAAQGRLQDAQGRLEESVTALRAARKSAAKRFTRAVQDQLRELAMADAAFEVALTEREPGPCGADAVDFLIAPNPGVPAAPVREIASGGELSRVMLAIMAAADATSGVATLVFDEVDAGIGGVTARAVGARLQELSKRRQVLCITHLPQIASLADRHFSIVKDTAAQTTRTTVLQLAEQEVVAELVRMLGADSEDSGARKHARELLRAA